MEDDMTPRTRGRGRGLTRSTQPPARLNYAVLGNPTLGGNMMNPPSQINQPKVKTPTPRALSVASSLSSTASRLRNCERETQKKIIELEMGMGELQTEQGNLGILKIELQDVEARLAVLKTGECTPEAVADAKRMQSEILTIMSNMRRSELKLELLQRDFDRRKKLIELDGEAERDLIVDEDNAFPDDIAVIEDVEGESSADGNDNSKGEGDGANGGIGDWLTDLQTGANSQLPPQDDTTTNMSHSSKAPQTQTTDYGVPVISPKVTHPPPNDYQRAQAPARNVNQSHNQHSSTTHFQRRPEPQYEPTPMGNVNQLHYQQPSTTHYQQKNEPHRESTERHEGLGVNDLVAALGKAFGHQTAERKLPKFTGCPAEWLRFKAAYSAMRAKVSDKGVMIRRLGDALDEDAEKAVVHLLPNPLNLDKVMEVLERRFGKAEFVLNYLVEKTKSCKSPDLKSPKTLIDFGTSVDALVENILAYDKRDYLKDHGLLQLLLGKLPGPTRHRWFEFILMTNTDQPDLWDFSKWLNAQVMIAECEVSPTFTDVDREEKSKREPKSPRANRRHGVHAAASDEDKPNCICCNKPKHNIVSCFIFKKMPVSERREFAKDKQLCYLCLKPGHMTRKCKNESCDVNSCGRKHHKLLHDENFSYEKSKQQSKKEESAEEDHSPSAPVENVLGAAASANVLPIIPVKVKGPAGTIKVYALLDSGATFSMIEAGVAAKLGLKGTKEELKFTVFGDKRSEPSWNVSLDVASDSKNGKFYNMKSVHTIKKLDLPGRTFNADAFKKKYPHARKMNAASMKDAKPQMVIGINAGGLFAAREILEVEPGQTPAAIRSLLGWYVAHDEATVTQQFHFLCECKKKERELSQAMKEFFSTEAFGVQLTNSEGRSKDDERALKLLDDATIQSSDDKRWSSCLLWKDDNLALPSSKQMAMKRLNSMERKMDKDPAFAKLCLEKFQEYQDKKYLLPKVGGDDMPRRWHLPWFFANHPTKKPRLVFDGAAKVNGKSLNDYLLTGPDLLQPLPAVLMRFRRHLIGLTADIKEMFHQVSLVKLDRASQTVLFRGMDRSSPPKELEMSVLFFGSASSPSSAIFAKDRNAEKYAEKYPTEVKAIKKDMYMDDLQSGGDKTAEVIQNRRNLSEIHESGGFLLTKWNSNSKEVMASIPPEYRAESFVNFTTKGEVSMDKTLGIYWDPFKDEFGFKVSFAKVPDDVKNVTRLPTKREMASVVMSLFDPLGFVMPLKVKAMCLMQEVWKLNTDWDETISDNLAADWKSWMEMIPLVEKVRVPRRLSPFSLKDCSSIQLHCFVDASQDAFAAVAYWRIDTGGSVVLSFIMGKGRVAPIKGLTIPRMELQAGVMGARLIKFICEAFGEDIRIEKKVFWSDSKTVLSWIQSRAGRFNTFVANRIGEIAELTSVADWRWIPTKLNVADDSTRANSDIDLESTCRWLTGPEFLKLDEEEWPVEKVKCPADLNSEEDEAVLALAVAEELCAEDTGPFRNDGSTILERFSQLTFPDPAKYSSWFKLVRTTAQCIRGTRTFFKNQSSKYLKLTDLDAAKQILISRAQREMFPAEMKRLENGKEIDKQSKIYSLNPALENGLIVHRGRILNAKVSSSIKCPPILDPAHPYTRLMVRSFHEAGGHWGQERIMNELRLQVWILDSRTAVKRAWANCLFCQHRRAVPRPPQMGQLPEARLDAGKPPFFHTGVDYFGPYEVKLQRSTIKRYGVMFTCLTTRAVHLELAQSLSTNDFLNTLARFISIRGKPAHVWSDNGKNFVGAEREIGRAIKRLEDDNIEGHAISKEIEWHFIVPLSPHMGGSWERLIGLTKKILSTLIKEHHPKEDTLRTFLHEVMGIMNSRPITYASVDPEDDLCLTPNHLLNVPCVVGATIPGMFDASDRMRKSWRHCQLLVAEFWSRFSMEYLPWLSKRQKWLQKVEPLKIGDMVLIVEDNAKRSSWKKGRIVKISLAKDGQARSAEVRVATVDPDDKKKQIHIKHYQRPVVKLCKWSLGTEDAVAGRENVLDNDSL